MASNFRRAGLVGAATLVIAAFGAAAFAQGQGMHGHRGHHGGHHGGIEHAIAQVKDKLALDTSQQVLWDNAVAATKSARQAGRAEREKVHAALQAEISKAEPDLAALAAATDAAQESGQALRRQVRGEWLKLYATFTASQKLVVRDQLAKRMERFEHFRERMHERFGGQRG